MCKWGTTRKVTVVRELQLDSCIAEEIVELNRLGVKTEGSCCGHETVGHGVAQILPSSRARALDLGYEVSDQTETVKVGEAPVTDCYVIRLKTDCMKEKE